MNDERRKIFKAALKLNEGVHKERVLTAADELFGDMNKTLGMIRVLNLCKNAEHTPEGIKNELATFFGRAAHCLDTLKVWLDIEKECEKVEAVGVEMLRIMVEESNSQQTTEDNQ